MKNSKMTPKLYYRAYKFLHIRAAEGGSMRPFRAICDLSYEEQEIICQFLQYNHNCQFI